MGLAGIWRGLAAARQNLEPAYGRTSSRVLASPRARTKPPPLTRHTLSLDHPHTHPTPSSMPTKRPKDSSKDSPTRTKHPKRPARLRGPDHHRPYRRPLIGAPTTYEPAFCERIIHCGNYGYSFTQMAHDLGTVRQTLMEWAERHPAFADSLIYAREAAMTWWETQSQKGLWAGKDYNDRVMKFIMTNQHRDHYRERVEVSGALARIDFGRLTDEQLAGIADGKHPYEVLAPKREVLAVEAGGVPVVEGVPVEESDEVVPSQPTMDPSPG